MARRERALQPPAATGERLDGFPRRTLRAGTTWFRQHHDRPGGDRGAWFFASHALGEDGGGRFDLAVPRGTCYLSSTERGALNELVGPECAVRGWVDADLLAGRVVSRLSLPVDVVAANTTSSRAADFRVTTEIATTERYDITQAWAEALLGAGFGGVVALLRFTPGAARMLALFGGAGAPDPGWPGDPDAAPARALAEGWGIEVVDPPALADVVIVAP
ncbi:MAG: RES domain-containing protein [Nocardioidaceae bacterium]